WTAKCFVSSGSHNVCILNWVLMQPYCHQSSNMRHINHKVTASFISDRFEFFKVDGSRISTCTSNDQLGLVYECQLPNLFIINGFGSFINAIHHKMILLAAKVDG